MALGNIEVATMREQAGPRVLAPARIDASSHAMRDGITTGEIPFRKLTCAR